MFVAIRQIFEGKIFVIVENVLSDILITSIPLNVLEIRVPS